MSYTRTYHQRIAVHFSGSVSYPASQNGGSVSYSGTEYEDVTVNIDVDTSPFDASVNGCNKSVNFLTGAVVATEAAQIVSIDQNAKKVGTTVVEGFFKTIRSEISQQIVELSQKIDAHLMHLRELSKSCAGKQKQMETDYNRLSTRYLKIFEDMNNELSNRIYELNKPAFVFKKECDNHAIRTSGNDLVSTVAVFGAEGGGLQAKISASVAKKRALETISQTNIFLWKQKKLENTVNQCMMNENISAKKYAPVCLLETQNEKSQIGKQIYQNDFMPQTYSNEIIEEFKNQSWMTATKEKKEQIQRYFNAEVSNTYSTNSKHNDRVKEIIVKFFDMNSIQSF
jgi:hypothetical protein